MSTWQARNRKTEPKGIASCVSVFDKPWWADWKCRKKLIDLSIFRSPPVRRRVVKGWYLCKTPTNLPKSFSFPLGGAFILVVSDLQIAKPLCDPYLYHSPNPYVCVRWCAPAPCQMVPSTYKMLRCFRGFLVVWKLLRTVLLFWHFAIVYFRFILFCIMIEW